VVSSGQAGSARQTSSSGEARDQQIKALQQRIDQLERMLKDKQTPKQSEARRPAQTGERARVTVHLPADARLFIDDTDCPLTSDTRVFETPPLEPGRSFYYTLKAEVTRDGKPRVASQQVIVEAGKQVTVEFKNLPALATARR
jgi:uncharacterized protein (TIGR03000 family)